MTKPKLIVPIGHTNAITSVAFSPDGQLLLTGSMDQTAKLWDWTGRELLTFSEQSFFIYGVAFSPNGTQIATASSDKSAKIWNLDSGEVTLRLEGHQKAVYALSFSPDGKRLLTGSGDGTAILWHAGRGSRQASLAGPGGAIRAVAFSPDGERMLMGGDDGVVILWSVQTRKPLQTWEAHPKSVTSVAFSPRGDYVLTGSADRTVRIWDAGGGELIRVLEGRAKGIRSVAFAPDGKRLLAAGEDGRAVVWDLTSGEALMTLKGHRAALTAAAYSPNGQAILTASRDRTARLWQAATGKQISIFKGHAAAITDVDFSSDETQILIGTDARTAAIWDVNKGQTIATFRGHQEIINTVAFSPDNRFILTASDDHTARVWDVASGKELSMLNGHAKGVKSAAFSRDGRWVATGSADATAKLWDWAAGACLDTFTGHRGAVNDVAFSSDGKQILTGSSDRTARIWDPASGQVRNVFEGHAKTVRSVAFSPDDRYVLTGSYDSTARIWDAHSGELVRELSGHQYDVRAAVFSPDGSRVLTGSYDETARVWDADTGKCLLTLTGHESAPRAVTFSPGGHRILTGSRDNMVKIWDGLKGMETASLVQIDAQDWVVTTPSGLFDASPAAMELMYYVAPFQKKKGTEWVVIELDQLKERYYEPGLLAKIMGFRKGDIRDVRHFEQVNLFPRITARIEDGYLRIRLEKRNGGLGKLSLFINHKEVLEDANPARRTTLSVSLRRFGKYYFPSEVNQIGLLVYNEDGWLRSEMLVLPYQPVQAGERGAGRRPGPGKKKPSELQSLHAVVVGTSRYGARSIRDLNFPDKDAADVASALQLAGERLFPTPPNIHLLTTDAASPAHLAAKENIRAAFQQIAAVAKPQDVFLLYLAGHGATYGGSDAAQFYYLTSDLPTDNLHDPAIRSLGAISGAEFTQWIKQIAAGKQVFILDTCHAGKIVDNLAGGRYLDNAVNIRALDRMKDRTGMFVLAGSAADHFSYEASIFGQGLLTYSILLGMKGGALIDDLIDVSRLLQFARDKVPEFAGTIHQQQEPVVAVPRGGASFYLGKLDRTMRESIQLAEPKPVVTASIFLDREACDDSLHLAATLDDFLRSLNARGKYAPFIFLDVPYLDIAYYVRGLYTREHGTVDLKGRVFKGGKDVGLLLVRGREEDPEQLVKKIADEVIRLIHPAS